MGEAVNIWHVIVVLVIVAFCLTVIYGLVVVGQWVLRRSRDR
jgi:hypothetical protein